MNDPDPGFVLRPEGDYQQARFVHKVHTYHPTATVKSFTERDKDLPDNLPGVPGTNFPLPQN